jgi:hypothetical protein
MRGSKNPKKTDNWNDHMEDKKGRPKKGQKTHSEQVGV